MCVCLSVVCYHVCVCVRARARARERERERERTRTRAWLPVRARARENKCVQFFFLDSARTAKPNPDWAVFVARDEGTSYHVHTLYSALTEDTTCQLVRDNCLLPAVASPAYRFPALSSASVPRLSLSATDRKQRHSHSVVRTGSRFYWLHK